MWSRILNPTWLRLAAVVAGLAAACTGANGPTGLTEQAHVSGVLTLAAPAGAAALADGEDDPFAGSMPLGGARLRLVSASGEVLFEARSDSDGRFEVGAPAGEYRLEIVLDDGSSFTLGVSVREGERLFVRAKVEMEGGHPVINAEVFTDNDGDGASDTGVTVQIVGREAGRPESGEQREGPSDGADDPSGEDRDGGEDGDEGGPDDRDDEDGGGADDEIGGDEDGGGGDDEIGGDEDGGGGDDEIGGDEDGGGGEEPGGREEGGGEEPSGGDGSGGAETGA